MRYCEELVRLFKGDPEFEVSIVLDKPYGHPIWGAYYDKEELKQIIKDSGADIVHVNGFTTLGVRQAIIEAHRQGKKVALTPHWHPFHTLGRPVLGKGFFKLIIEHPVRKFVDGIVTFNDEDTQFFKRFNTHCARIPHWMMRNINPTEAARDKRMVLFVGGRLDDSTKGGEHLQSIPEGKYDIHVVGRGEMPLRSDMTLHTDLSDSELFKLYSRAGVVVVPSRYESFSYVTLEALSAGAPLVISDRVRIGDYLRDCTQCAVFNYHDMQGFNEAIDRMAGHTGDVSASLQPFLPQTAHESYREFYRKLMSGD